MKKNIATATKNADAFDKGRDVAVGSDNPSVQRRLKDRSKKLLSKGTPTEKMYHNKGVKSVNTNEEVEQIDEVNSRHSLEAAQAALTPTARRIKDALSKTNRAKSNTNKYARRISKISPDYTKNDVKDHLRSMGEDLNYRRVYEPTSAQALNPGLQKRIDDASNAQKPAPAGRRPIDKIKLMTRKEEVELDEANLKSKPVFHNGKEIGETGIDDEASPGNGKWYAKHHKTKFNSVGFDSRREAEKEVLAAHRVREEVELDEWRHSEVQRQAKRISKGMSSDEATARMKATREKEEAARRAKRAASKTVEEGYKGRKAFGSAYDKTHDPFQDSKRAFKSRELEHELAHETPSGPAHHDQTPHDVHIDGKKWKTFGSAGHAHNVANKLSISGKRASVHKTPIAEMAPPGWEGTVKAMKKHSEIDNPFALAWWMKRKGAKSHKDEK